MNEVFISYARSDRPVAKRLAEALQARGLGVWWDRDLAPGQRFAQVIAEELASTRCVVVLWSQAALASHWVSDEAAEGQRRGVLVPAVIETGLQPPLGFRGHHTADVGDWVQQRPCAEFERLVQAVQRMARGLAPPPRPEPPPPAPVPAPMPAPAPPPPAPPAPPEAKPVWQRAWFAAAVAGLALFGLAYEEGWLDPESGLDASGPIVVATALQARLQWRDEVLAYGGQVVWDGSSPTALVTASITDLPSGRPLGEQQILAQVQQPQIGQLLVRGNAQVPWDSNTPGPHVHDVNLLFQLAPNGGWQFVRNCRTGPQGQPLCW